MNSIVSSHSFTYDSDIGDKWYDHRYIVQRWVLIFYDISDLYYSSIVKI